MIASILILAGLAVFGLGVREEIAGRLQAGRRLHRLTARGAGADTAAHAGLRLPPAIEAWAVRAGIDPERLPPLLAGAALLGACLSLPLGSALWLPPGALGGAGLAAGVLQLRAERRRRDITKMLPGFMDRLRQQLTVGASASSALERAVAGSPPVLRAVFAPALWRQRHGAPLNDALVWLAQRERSAELGAFASAIAASARFGGRLSDARDNLARTLRDRQRVEREMKSATAEVRASAFILALLPLVVAAALLGMSSAFRAHFGAGGAGRWLLPWLGCAYLAGLLMIRRVARPSF